MEFFYLLMNMLFFYIRYQKYGKIENEDNM